VPTRILDEDQYPVGGYTSISTRGSVESLLHSQLAYMEDAGGAREPDLFDVKFARDELFYYSRDENQFLRRRRAFVFVFLGELVTGQVSARYKSPDLDVQPIVLVLSTVLTVVEKLSEWLSTDAIRFELLFVQDGDKRPLADEAKLCELLLRGCRSAAATARCGTSRRAPPSSSTSRSSPGRRRSTPSSSGRRRWRWRSTGRS
jgi:hypothetical protein